MPFVLHVLLQPPLASLRPLRGPEGVPPLRSPLPWLEGGLLLHGILHGSIDNLRALLEEIPCWRVSESECRKCGGMLFGTCSIRWEYSLGLMFLFFFAWTRCTRVLHMTFSARIMLDVDAPAFTKTSCKV